MGERISRDFTWEKMTYSRVAVENGLLNEPPFEVRLVMMELVKRLLQPLRVAEYECLVDALFREKELCV